MRNEHEHLRHLAQRVEVLRDEQRQMADLLRKLAKVLIPRPPPEPEDVDSTVAVMHKGVELGCRVHLDEDVYNAAHVPPRTYVFEAYDSSGPADSNCTLVDVDSGDWMMRGLGELVPVDDDPEDHSDGES